MDATLTDATLEDVTKKTRREPTAEELAAEEMVRRAREQGLSLTGPDGLLKQLTKQVLETALNQEMTEYLGHEKHGRPAPGSGNIRNGTRPKTVLTESTGQVGIQVPRDRDGTFEPQIVKKRQRRLNSRNSRVLSSDGSPLRSASRKLVRSRGCVLLTFSVCAAVTRGGHLARCGSRGRGSSWRT